MPTNYIYGEESKGLFGMVSSTEIRRRISQERKSESPLKHLGISGLVTKGTLDYIVKHNLY